MITGVACILYFNTERLAIVLLVSIFLLSACSNSSVPTATDSVSLESPVQAGIELVSDKTFRIRWQ